MLDNYPEVIEITMSDVDNRFPLHEYEPLNDPPFERAILFKGDVDISSSLTHEWLNNFAKSSNSHEILVIVNGNLKVGGKIDIGGAHCLLVCGNVECDVFESNSSMICITGDAKIKYVFRGEYNHGGICIQGKTHAPYVINYDHSAKLQVEKGIIINYYSDYNDFFTYDYTKKDFANVIEDSLLMDDGSLDSDAFITQVIARKSPLKI